MVNDSLYTKYRPKKFEDVYGQKYIQEILKNQIKLNKFTHAYLFSGTRGTGKTTCARIFSKAINCIHNEDGNPCYNCKVCNEKNINFLNVIELDAASNNSVDQIRNLIEELRYSNFSGGYKIYILDEVHMLSINAFNALLKTLEEPPENVIFILSTTEIRKIPQTIISRCQRFEFKNIEIKDIIKRLKYICENENILIDEESLEIIAYMGNGSMRDSISILERVLLYGENITSNDVRKILGITSREFIFELLNSIFKKDLNTSLKIIYKLFEEDVEIKLFIEDLRNILRDIIFLKLNSGNKELLNEKNEKNIEYMEKLSNLTSISDLSFLLDKINEILNKNLLTEIEYRIYLELLLIKHLNTTQKDYIENKSFIEIKGETIKSNQENKSEGLFNENSWEEFLNYLKKNTYMVLYSLLQHGNVEKFYENKIFFKCNTQGILNRLKSENTIKQIEDALKKFFSTSIIFEVFSNEEIRESKIEDKMRRFFGDDVEIENK